MVFISGVDEIERRDAIFVSLTESIIFMYEGKCPPNLALVHIALEDLLNLRLFFLSIVLIAIHLANLPHFLADFLV